MIYPKNIYLRFLIYMMLIEEMFFIGMGLYGAYHGIIKYNFDALAIGNLAFVISIFIHFYRHSFARKIIEKEQK